MGTTRSFSAMLNEHLNYDLLKEEFIKRDFILQTAEKDNDWLGGTLPVPFKGAQASSVSFGQLTSSSDVAEDKYVRGSITSQPEVWGTMLFNQRDLMEHDKISEQNFLKILPDAVEDFMDFMKMCVSLSFTNGSAFAKALADGTAGGVLQVDRPERFVIGMKVGLKDGDTALAYYYVIAIDIDSGNITFSATRGGAAADISAYSLAQITKCYFDGSQTQPLTDLKSSLLSLANGGSTTLYGQTKTAYPYLQSIQIDGSLVTATNILDKIFDGFTKIRNRGKGNPNNVLLSYKHLGSILKLLEMGKGAFNVVPGSRKASVYGWDEVEITTVKGTLKIVAIQEMDDDWIGFIDWRAIKIHSNGFFRKRKNPDTGAEYFEVRAQSGFQYLVDIAFFGDLVLNRPSYCGVMFNVGTSTGY